jgi:hypothetical protein
MKAPTGRQIAVGAAALVVGVGAVGAAGAQTQIKHSQGGNGSRQAKPHIKGGLGVKKIVTSKSKQP